MKSKLTKFIEANSDIIVKLSGYLCVVSLFLISFGCILINYSKQLEDMRYSGAPPSIIQQITYDWT